MMSRPFGWIHNSIKPTSFECIWRILKDGLHILLFQIHFFNLPLLLQRPCFVVQRLDVINIVLLVHPLVIVHQRVQLVKKHGLSLLITVLLEVIKECFNLLLHIDLRRQRYVDVWFWETSSWLLLLLNGLQIH